MNRSTQNATQQRIKTPTMKSSMFDTVFGSPDGIVDPATTELDQLEFEALGVGATYPIVPSSEFNGLVV